MSSDALSVAASIATRRAAISAATELNIACCSIDSMVTGTRCSRISARPGSKMGSRWNAASPSLSSASAGARGQSCTGVTSWVSTLTKWL